MDTINQMKKKLDHEGEKCTCGHINQSFGWSMEVTEGEHTYSKHIGMCYEPDCTRCASKYKYGDKK